jgi:hypothetical protein
MDGTILSQGTFTVGATVVPQIVQIPSNADFMWVKNFTQYGNIGTPATATGLNYYWQRGMPVGSAFVEYGANGVKTLSADTIPSGGFTLYDPSGQSGAAAAPLVGPAVATTATTDATRPVVTTASTAGIAVGTVVRVTNNAGAASSIYGIDMVVSAVTLNTNFTLLTANNALATTPGQAGTNGFYRIINVDSPFYPRDRVITNITLATSTVATSIAHGLTPGQAIRFSIPNICGTTQLNPTSANNYLYATILTVVDDYTFTVDTNMTSFTAFRFPTIVPNNFPTSLPQIIPIGENTASALTLPGNQVPSIGGVQIPNTNTGILADSTVNTQFLGMILGTGGTGASLTAAISGPAGSIAGDVMYWVAGKSTYGGL